MKQNKINSLLFFLIILIFTISGALSSWGNTVNKIEFLNNKLEVNVEKESLGSVLSKVQAKTGIKFLLDKDEVDKIISINFQPLPIDRALKRILNKLNYAIVFGPNGNIQEVIIIGKNKKSLKPTVYEGNNLSTTNTIIIKSPSGESMKITPAPDANAMFTTPPNKEGMKVSPPPGEDAMIVTPPNKDMKVSPPSGADAMTVTPPNKDMKVSPPSGADAMTVTPPSNEDMKTNPPRDENTMIIKPPSKEGM